MPTTISTGPAETLRMSLRGDVVTPADAAYEAAARSMTA